MQTPISRMADKVIESALLLAVLILPIFFNPYSARIFEGDKAALLRILAWIAGTAWLIRLIENFPRWGAKKLVQFLQDPLALATLLLALSTFLAGLNSITPHLSRWGSYQRSQGLLTLLGYLILFACTITTISRPASRQRLLTTLCIASGPVSLFAVVQFAGLNPVPWSSIDPTRVFGTLDNPIFLGAYLILLIPLTLVQLLRDLSQPATRRGWGWIAWIALLALQLTATILSGSRGPLMGLGAGLLLFLLLLALHTHRRKLAGGLMALLGTGILFLVLFNLPNTPLAPLREAPVIGRFGYLLSGGSEQVRTLIWHSIEQRFAQEPSRLILGFGPEATHAALLPAYQPALRRLEPDRLPDRAHNLFMEALTTTGILGFISLLLLFMALFYTGLRTLGWMTSSRARNTWLGITLAGVLLGLILPRVFAGTWAYAGLAVALGLALSQFGFLLSTLRSPERTHTFGLNHHSLLAAGILAATMGHLVETSVGIRVTTTQTIFWVLAGLLVTLTLAPQKAERSPSPSAPSAPEKEGITLVWDSQQAAFGLLGGILLTTLAFGLFLIGGANIQVSQAGRWIVLLGSWILAGTLWRRPLPFVNKPGTGWILPALSVVWVTLFLLLREILLLLGGDAITLLKLYVVWLLLTLTLVASLLPRPPALLQRSRQPWRALAYAALAALLLIPTVPLFLRTLQADIYLEAAEAHARVGQWPQALAFYEQAAAEAPQVDVYHQHLGEAYAQAALLAQDLGQRELFFESAEQAFYTAIERNPAEGTHRFNLAHLYLLWGQTTGDPGRRPTVLNQAVQLFEQLASQLPNDPRILDEWGLALQALGQPEGALAKFQEALAADPDYIDAYLHLGNLYEQSGKAGQALQIYQQAIQRNPNTAAPYRALADLYRKEGRLADAVAAQKQAASLEPTDFVIHQNLALLYHELGQLEEAINEAKLALAYAPPERKEALQNFIQSLMTNTP